jgi:phosphate transport system permease protein
MGATNSKAIDPADIPAFLNQGMTRANGVRVQIDELESGSLNRLNYQLERLRLERRSIELRESGSFSAQPSSAHPSARLNIIDAEMGTLQTDYLTQEVQLRELYEALDQDTLVLQTADGQQITARLADTLHAWYPNDMSTWDKGLHYASAIWRFLSQDPREANTEGGIFPAIFGTVLMVLLMSLIVTPCGVIAAVYLREYAKQGAFVRVIRIAVNNLAGVPSIVYGVFGLGFFVYFLGGNLDQLFYPEALPAPTFGTPGLLWASLTLALLTVPVVIVSTEEGLTRVPRALREGSLALGATKAETLFKIVLPMASPSILTGVILAVARAAGEVAPLMLVGVVKLAPTLPLDGNFPFLHLDRKFMHLGFHIYDVGFQSPNVEAARPLVYATALLLIILIIFLNLAAITLRSRLEQRYRGVES